MNKCKSYQEIIDGELNIPGDIYRHMSIMINSDDDKSELIVKMLNIFSWAFLWLNDYGFGAKPGSHRLYGHGSCT